MSSLFGYARVNPALRSRCRRSVTEGEEDEEGLWVILCKAHMQHTVEHFILLREYQSPSPVPPPRSCSSKSILERMRIRKATIGLLDSIQSPGSPHQRRRC